MPEQQRNRPGKGVAVRDLLGIGDATSNIRERGQQHAGIHAISNLRGGQRPNHIRQTTCFQ